MHSFSLRGAAVVALLAAAPAAAQGADTARALPAPGAFSLSVSHGSGSSLLGVGRMVGARTRVDLGLGLTLRRLSVEIGGDEQSVRDEMLTARLGVRRYLFSDDGIAPFLGAAASGMLGSQRGDSDANDASRDLRGLGAQLSAGAEWFPTPRVGISGETGLSVQSFRTEDDLPATDDTVIGQDWAVSTFTSAVGVSIYF